MDAESATGSSEIPVLRGHSRRAMVFREVLVGDAGSDWSFWSWSSLAIGAGTSERRSGSIHCVPLYVSHVDSRARSTVSRMFRNDAAGLVFERTEVRWNIRLSAVRETLANAGDLGSGVSIIPT